MKTLTKALGGLALLVGLAATVDAQDTLRHTQQRSFQEFYLEGRNEYPKGSYKSLDIKVGGININSIKRKSGCNEETLGFDFEYNRGDSGCHKGLEKIKRLKGKVCEGIKEHGEVLKEDLCDVGHDIGCAGKSIIERGIDISISVHGKIKEHIARSKERCRTARPEYHHPRTCRPSTCEPKMPITCTPKEPVYIPEPATCKPAAPEIYIPIPSTCRPSTCTPKPTVIPFEIQRPSTCIPLSNQARHAYEHEDGSRSYFDGNLSTGDVFIKSEIEYGPNGNTQINIFKRKQTGPTMNQTPTKLYNNSNENPRTLEPPIPKPNWASLLNNFQRS